MDDDTAEEKDDLRRQVAALEVENQTLRAEYLRAASAHAEAAELLAACHRLHGTLERKEVIAVLHEIIANLVGSETVAIFELEPESRELTLLSACGIDPELYAEAELEHSAIGHAIRTGEVYLGGQVRARDGSAHPVIASIPLTVGADVCGAIALFDLLGHKAALASSDLELFNLLRTHAGMALHCTRLHQNCTRANLGPTA